MDDWDFDDSEPSSVEQVELTEEEQLRMTCEVMLEYLERGYLEVGVNRENCTRIVVSQNTKWYQDFCACYQSASWVYRNGKRTKRKKRHRTYIKRCDTIAALKRMAKGDFSGEYAERLIYYVQIFWTEYAQGW